MGIENGVGRKRRRRAVRGNKSHGVETKVRAAEQRLELFGNRATKNTRMNFLGGP